MIGTTVSRYRILAKLGDGGMGVVYEAEDGELGRRVAIKFLPEGAAASGDALERFRREARAASALDHPNICVVHDVGRHAGRPFLVMERLKGQTLRHAIGERGMPIERVVALGEQIADALEAAHRAGIVHRDLKPANLFVTERGDAKVLDFGLAKFGAGEPSGAPAADAPTVPGEFLTAAGRRLGTVAYMSPEQARGETVDARSDLFSLGVVLYEMLTGRQPFAGANTAEYFAAILTADPAPPSELRPEIPPRLEAIVRKALEKDPALRYQSAAGLRSDLLLVRRESSGDPTADAWRSSARVGGRERPLGRPGGSRRLLVGSAVAAAAIALVYLVALGGGRSATVTERPRATPPPAAGLAAAPERSIAVLPFRDLSERGDQAYLSEGIAEDLLTLLANVRELKVIARSSSFSFKGKDLRPSEIARELGVVHLLDGSVRRVGDRIRVSATLVDARSETPVWAETYDRRLDDVFAVQDEIAQAVAGRLALTLLGRATAIDPDAYALFLQARELSRHDTREGWERAIPLLERALAAAPDYAPAWDSLAVLYMNQAGFGLRPLAEGLRLAETAIDRALTSDPLYAPAHSRRAGLAMQYRGDLPAAARHMQRALELAPESSVVLGNAAALARLLGRLELAIAAERHALSLDPLSVSGHFELAACLRSARRFDEAVAAFRAALRLSPGRVGGPTILAFTLVQNGEAEAAPAVLETEPEEAYRWIARPIVLQALGRRTEADAALAELIGKYEREAAYNIAFVFAYRNEADRAFEWLSKARQFADPGLSEIAVEPLFDNLRGDPRWLTLLRELGKAPEQLAAIPFDIELPPSP
jgi:TolB-like protein/Flp pilus assembly protein TadD